MKQNAATCVHRERDGLATARDIARYADGDVCPTCGCVLRAGAWYLDDPLDDQDDQEVES